MNIIIGRPVEFDEVETIIVKPIQFEDNLETCTIDVAIRDKLILQCALDEKCLMCNSLEHMFLECDRASKISLV